MAQRRVIEVNARVKGLKKRIAEKVAYLGMPARIKRIGDKTMVDVEGSAENIREIVSGLQQERIGVAMGDQQPVERPETDKDVVIEKSEPAPDNASSGAETVVYTLATMKKAIRAAKRIGRAVVEAGVHVQDVAEIACAYMANGESGAVAAGIGVALSRKRKRQEEGNNEVDDFSDIPSTSQKSSENSTAAEGRKIRTLLLLSCDDLTAV